MTAIISKPFHRLFASILCLSLVISACSDEGEDARTTAEDCLSSSSTSQATVIDGDFIVAFDGQNDDAGGRSRTIARTFEAAKIPSEAVVERIEGRYTSYVVHLTDQQLAALQSSPAVKIVEPDRLLKMCGCFSVVDESTITWNVKKVGYGDGRGKTAWILDTGVDTDHPDLNVDKTRSTSFVTDESSIEDENGHGTHIAGVIGALNNKEGILGIASGASIVALKVLKANGEGKLSSLLNALAYVRRNAKPGEVVNISMNLDDISQILDQEIQSIASKGVYFTIAAGNGGEDVGNASPAHTPGANIFTVSAVDSTNHLADFSNYGSAVDYAAPGVKILSTYSKGRYAYLSGTSMAAPHVAGVLLITEGNPTSAEVVVNDPDGKPDPIIKK